MTDECIKEYVMHNTVLFSIKKGNPAVAVTWMNPENMLLSETSQAEKDKYRINACYMESEKGDLISTAEWCLREDGM